MGPFHLLMGNIHLATFLNIAPQVSSTREESTLVISSATTPVAPGSSPGTKWWHCLPKEAVSSPQSGDEAVGTFKELPCLWWKDEMLLMKSLKVSQWEAFTKDSDQVWQAREYYFKTNCPHFNHKTLHNLSGVFQDLITYTNLLGSQILQNTGNLDGVGRPAICQWCIKDFAKGCVVPSALHHLRNCPRSWAWLVFITWMPFATLLGWPSALGAERRGKMKGL